MDASAITARYLTRKPENKFHAFHLIEQCVEGPGIDPSISRLRPENCSNALKLSTVVFNCAH